MASIEQNLKNILNARYGEEVRTSIHDSIEQCYDYTKLHPVCPMVYPTGFAVINFDTLKKTITIPKDTYVFTNGFGSNEYYRIRDSASIDYGSESRGGIFRLVVNTETGSFRLLEYNGHPESTELTLVYFRASEGVNENSIIYVVSCFGEYSINDVKYGQINNIEYSTRGNSGLYGINPIIVDGFNKTVTIPPNTYLYSNSNSGSNKSVTGDSIVIDYSGISAKMTVIGYDAFVKEWKALAYNDSRLNHIQKLMVVHTDSDGRALYVSAPFPCVVNGKPSHNDYSLAAIGYYPSANSINPIINFDTVNEQIEFPADIILLSNSFGNGFKRISTQSTNLSYATNGSTITSNLLKVVYDVVKNELKVLDYASVYGDGILLIVFRTPRNASASTQTYVSTTIPYKIDGYLYGIRTSSTPSPTPSPSGDVSLTNDLIKSINHRGYNSIAPENTLSAFKLSKTMGFKIVETDVRWTKDKIPVCIHDATISRTSDHSGQVYSYTLDQLKGFDFGSWKGVEYTNERIPTFEEFIKLCRDLGLKAYVEIKGYNDDPNFGKDYISSLISITKKVGMIRNVSWMSYDLTSLQYVKDFDKEARIGLLVSGSDVDNAISQITPLRSDNNEIFLGISSQFSSKFAPKCVENNIPLEVFTVDTKEGIIDLDPYVTSVISNNLIAGNVLVDNALGI